MIKQCILYEGRICSECGDCIHCDLSPDKICDNCGSCMDDMGYDYKVLKIDDIENNVD